MAFLQEYFQGAKFIGGGGRSGGWGGGRGLSQISRFISDKVGFSV